MRRIGWLFLASLLTIAFGAFRVKPAEDPAAELARLAKALGTKPDAEAYARLAAFAEQQAGTEPGAQAALRLGLADFEQQRWQRAEEQLARATASAVLGDYARFYLAQAQRRRDLHAEALHTLGELRRQHRESRLAEAAAVEQAALLVELGRLAEARASLTGAPGWRDRPALLLALARVEAADGEMARAVELLHRVYYEFPLSPQAEPAMQFLNELRPVLGDRYTPPTEGLRGTRAERLWAAGAFQGARSAFVDLSVRASDATRRVARVRGAQAFYNLGGGARACSELEAISENELDSDLEPEWRSYRLQCRQRANDVAGVERELDRLRQRFAGSRWFAQSLFSAGNYLLASDDAARARAFFTEVLERFPASEWGPEAEWKLTWMAWLENDTAQAAGRMEELLRRFPDSPFTPRALYWRARIAERTGEVGLAARLSELLRTHFSRHYLGQVMGQAEWAQARGGSGDGEEAAIPNPAWLEGIVSRRPEGPPPQVPAELERLFERTRTLENLGLAQLAAEESAYALGKFPHPQAYLARVRTAFAQRQYPLAIESVRRGYPNYLDFDLDDLPREAWEVAFPRLYWNLIEHNAKLHRLDPYLVAALMRQESRFDPRAVSGAGARGLMQLMPETARRLAGLRRLNPDRLFEPEFNIRLGVRFLRELYNRFDGKLEYVVAAYNAGGTAVARWRDRRAWSEPAEFVESIPSSQTRDFVYLVTRNYQFYRDLYGSTNTE